MAALNGQKAKRRKKLDVDKNNQLKIFTNLLKKEEITLQTFINNSLNMYEFDALN